MIALLWLLALPTFAGPGFSGVGGPHRAPGFDDGAEAVDEAGVADVLRHEDELLRLVEQYDAKMHDKMLILKETDRRGYLAALVRVARNVQRARRDPAYRERVQAMRSTTKQLQELARSYHDLPQGERPARRAQLERLAGELMDLKQADRRSRLEEMRQRLAELQAEIDRRESQRDKIIDDFVNQLITERVEL